MNTRPADASDAVAALLEAEGGRLYSLARRFCGNAHDAEDLVQQVFINAARGWANYDGRGSPRTWLYTIAARACGRMHRRRAGEPPRIASLDAPLPFDEPLIAALPSGDDPVVDRAIMNEARQRVEQAVAELPDDFRMPVVLKELIGLPTEDVAAVLGIPADTVRSRVHRARLKLRAAVDAALPRSPVAAPPPAYPQRVCLDLLAAKQSALDRGVPFDAAVICERCRAVFATMDLAGDVCRSIAGEAMPPGLRERLEAAIRTVGDR